MQNGATINTASFAQATNVSLSLTIPWTGANPASGTLSFIHRPVNGWDDSFLDNIFIEAASVMPVKLSSFKGFVEDGITMLTWHTAAEFNTRIFEIEVSETDNGDFIKIDELDCKNMPFGASYKFTTLRSGYFRLKITDFDKYVEYSSVIKNLTANHPKTIVYPNPIEENRITLFVGSEKPKNLTATLCNSHGQLLKAFKITGPHQVLDIDDVFQGVLLLRLSNGKVFRMFKN